MSSLLKAEQWDTKRAKNQKVYRTSHPFLCGELQSPESRSVALPVKGLGDKNMFPAFLLELLCDDGWCAFTYSYVHIIYI